jgi:hypothetical protein
LLSVWYPASGDPSAAPGDDAPAAEDQEPTGEEPSKRERARQAYAALVAAGQPVTGARLAEAADISPSYGRALLVEFQADPTLAAQANGQRPGAEVGER